MLFYSMSTTRYWSVWLRMYAVNTLFASGAASIVFAASTGEAVDFVRGEGLEYWLRDLSHKDNPSGIEMRTTDFFI